MIAHLVAGAPAISGRVVGAAAQRIEIFAASTACAGTVTSIKHDGGSPGA